MRYEAVRLFAERADAAAPGFVLDDRNAGDVARICLRLDGLPLALELAAGRTGALSPAMIAERLDDRFRLLATGSRGAPTRQQTLAATLDWSHELLEDPERVLLRRLSTFAGSFDLAAAESVGGGDDLDVRETAHVLARLVEKSLVAVEGQDPVRRYRLLETVRLYARERLDRCRRDSSCSAAAMPAGPLQLAEREHASPALDRRDGQPATPRTTRSSRRGAGGCAAALPRAVAVLAAAHRARRGQPAVQRRPRGGTGSTPRSGRRRCSPPRRSTSAPASSPAVSPARRRAWRSFTPASRACAGAHSSSSAATRSRSPARARSTAAVAWFEQGLEIAQREGYAPEQALGVYSLGVTHWMGGIPDAEQLLLGCARPVSRARGRLRRGSPSPHQHRRDPRTPRSGDRPGLPMVLEETMQPFVEVSCAQATAYVLANCASVARSRGELRPRPRSA